MSIIRVCREGKETPKLVEVRCPQCKAWVEVFVQMDGAPGQTGTLVLSERCQCGYVLPAGSFQTDYEVE